MSEKKSMSPQPQGYFPMPRRRMLQMGAGALAFPGVLAACGSSDETATGSDAGGGDAFSLGGASGEVTVGSNYSNELPQAGLAAAVAALPNADVSGLINEVDHNTFQENISTYLQNPDDVIPWFAGFRMQFFAAQGLLGDITDVWDAGLDAELGTGFKTASTGLDGRQYFVPWTYSNWAIYYRPSVWAENGWEPPETLDELIALSADIESAGLTPFSFANDGNWPAMGTFDQLNFRINGGQFHVDLMAGRESWTDDRVREVFATYETLLAVHQDNPNGRTWEEAAAALVNGESAMYTIGTWVGSQFPDGDTSDLDFFPFPVINEEHGTDVVEAPIDGWMMAADPENEQAAKELLFHFGTGAAQDAYLAEDPSVVAPSNSVNTDVWSPLQQKVFEDVSNAGFVTQFLDRDTSPEFASNVAGPRIADFLADPSQIDSILEDMQAQAEVLLTGDE